MKTNKWSYEHNNVRLNNNFQLTQQCLGEKSIIGCAQQWSVVHNIGILIKHNNVQLQTTMFSEKLQRFLEQHIVYLTQFVSSEFHDLSRISLRSNGVNEDMPDAAVDLQHEQNSQ